MFCFQCQETVGNTGCTVRGVCGKEESTANLQDLLIYVLKGISIYSERLKELGRPDRSTARFIYQALFATITNANFDDERFVGLIREALMIREQLRSRFLAVYKEKTGEDFNENLHDAATWSSDDPAEFAEKATSDRRIGDIRP